MKNRKTGSSSYARSGVNLEAGDLFSAYAGELCRSSYRNSPFVDVHDVSRGYFRGPRGYTYKNLPDGCIMVAGGDGIGTKTVIITAAGMYSTASRNLLAMTAGDITRYGGLPLVFLNILEVKSLGKPRSSAFGHFKRLMLGLAGEAKKEGYVLLGGETAEMSACFSSEIVGTDIAFNWNGVMLGVTHPEKVIDGSSLAPGQVVIALRDGLRSNGASEDRKYFRGTFGTEWWNNPDALEEIAEAAEPAVLYDRLFTTANGWHEPDFRPKIKVHGIAHLSGGGIQSKFFEGLLQPSGHSAVLENLWEPPRVVANCVRAHKLPDDEAYTIFNGGQGALAVVDELDAPRFCVMAHGFGIQARPAGRIMKSRGAPLVGILSKFSGKKFFFR